MKRIDIRYGSDSYSVGDRDFEELCAEIEAGVASGHGWLRVNEGEGVRRDAFLFLSPGVHISVSPVSNPPDQAG